MVLSLGVAKVALLGALAAAAVGGAGAVLYTSGPLADEDAPTDGDTGASATPGASKQPDPTVAATPTLDVEPYDPDELLNGSVAVDFERLPPADDEDWVTFVAPNGSITMRLPAEWHIQSAKARNLEGEIVPGDTLTIRSGLPEDGPGEGQSLPGWVKLDAATTPLEVPIDAGAGSLVETVLADDGRRNARGFQYDADPARGDPHARMVLTLQDCSDSSGLCISLIATVDFDMKASVLADAVQAVLSVEVH